MIDRLEQQGFVERGRLEEDKRLSISRITNKGLRLLEDMQPEIVQTQGIFGERLSEKECGDLSRLLEKLYVEH